MGYWHISKILNIIQDSGPISVYIYLFFKDFKKRYLFFLKAGLQTEGKTDTHETQTHTQTHTQISVLLVHITIEYSVRTGPI